MNNERVVRTLRKIKCTIDKKKKSRLLSVLPLQLVKIHKINSMADKLQIT